MNSPFCGIRKGIPRLRAIVCAVILAAASICQAQPLAPPAAFGYQCKNVNGTLASGARPLLVICANFAGQNPLPQSPAYYSNLVFNAAQTPSMNGYYQAVSDGGFSVVPGGVVTLNLPASEDYKVYTNLYPETPSTPFVAAGAYASNLIAQAMSSKQFNFASYPTNGEGLITQDELAIMILVSDTNFLIGGSRPTENVAVPGLNYQWGLDNDEPFVALLGTEAPFIVWVEELEETWGAKDIYGTSGSGGDCLSMGLSPQSCFMDGVLYYVDPWNRMELGWCQPRIYSLTNGGSAILSAAQAGDPTAPIILYDPMHGTSEFFMLEYRTHTNVVWGAGYDATVAYGNSDGLVIWYVGQDANHNYVKIQSPISTNIDDSVWAENSPNLLPSDNPVLWGSGATTPNLIWTNGIQTLTSIRVLPFNEGDNTITVEWLIAGDTWVDFNYTGLPQSGTFANPYTNMAAGLSAVTYGGTLHIKTGSSTEMPMITKPMKIVNYNGPATIGN